MIDFIGTPPLLRITLSVAMATMHFHIAQICLFLGNVLGGPGTNLVPIKIVLGAR